MIVNPSWASIPSIEDMSEAYPTFAVMAGLDGDATMQCVARPDGALDLCEVLNTTPSGLGFDRAALTLTRRFRINPLEINGADTKSVVQFVIRFRAAPFEPNPPWTGPEPDADHVRNVRTLIDQMTPQVEREFTLALDDLDVDPDRLTKVQAILVQARSESAERQKQAAALAMARLLTPEEFARFQSGGRPPPRPSDDLFARAGDQANAVMEEELQRVKALYCAQYDCPILLAVPMPAPLPPAAGR